ncbi:MAG TPA: ABC transporter substrate-binding protein [Acidimicrobiales bacterium]|nr:ABC transporter substrate-binding protein [Acidimicrobiales bacterium]
MKPSPKHRIPRLLTGVGAAACAVLLVIGCARSDGDAGGADSGLQKVRVMLDWTPNTNHAGMYFAESEGYYRDAGLDVSIIQPGATSDPNQAVGAGTVDFGVSASEQLVPARAEGVPVVAIAAIIEHNTSSLVSLTSSGITRPRDLAGHTYGAYGATFERALIDALVSCDGGDPSEVRFTQVGDSDYRQGLTSGHFDTVWVFDGWDVIRLADIDGLDLDRISFADHTDCIPDWYTPIIVTSEDHIEHDPELVRKFMTATAHGYRDAMATPDKAADALLAAADGLDPGLVKRSMDYLSTHYTTDPARWGHQDPAIWDRFVTFLEDHDIVDEGFDVKHAFTNRFLPRSG